MQQSLTDLESGLKSSLRRFQSSSSHGSLDMASSQEGIHDDEWVSGEPPARVVYCAYCDGVICIHNTIEYYLIQFNATNICKII